MMGWSLNALSYVAPGFTGRYGFLLFCFPFRVPLSTRQREFLNTGVSSSFDHNGIKIQAYQWGTGPVKILLLHGWQSHTYRWKKYIESIDLKQYTVHAFDAPGHGLSGGRLLHVPLYAEVISRFMNMIGPVESIISHSLGSLSAFYCFHIGYPVQTNTLIALAPPGEVKEFFQFFRRSLSLSTRAINLIGRDFEERFGKSPSSFSAPIFAAAVTVPGLIVHDEDDEEAPVSHARRIHSAWRNSRCLITKGLGHNLRSEEVVKDVVRFVKETASQQMVLT